MEDIYTQAEEAYRSEQERAMTNMNYREDDEDYKDTESEIREEEIRANHLTDAKLGLI